MATDLRSRRRAAAGLRTHTSRTPGRMRAETSRVPDQEAVVVAVSGDVDEHTAPPLARLLLSALASAPPTVVVDLSNTDFLGMAGLELLLHARNRARFQRTSLCLAAPAPEPRRALHASGLHNLLPVSASLTAALTTLAAEPALAVGR